MANQPQPDENGRCFTAPARREIEWTLAGADATLADTDQTLSDRDQTYSDEDQTSADREQAAADRDQAASDADLQAGVNPAVHAFTRDVRRRTSLERERAAAERLQTATERDAVASARDAAARARDLAGEARDRAMSTLDEANAREDTSRAITGAEVVIRAGALRQRAAHYRALASEYRAQASADRQAAADDRAHGARDRLDALADREQLARQLAAAETDTLTGTRTRRAGLQDLRHEVDRCHRTSIPLTVAYLDVAGLTARNESRGRSARDQLLIDVVACMRRQLRTYDQITRLGGDEFVCAMPNMAVADAQARFSQIAAELAGAAQGNARTRFAELAPGDSADELLARVVPAAGAPPGRV
jgi:diguanylate cyclase (GGDEF)-like protein